MAITNGLDPKQLPKHVGIIMDGNGRWAKKRGLPRVAGHKEGAKTVKMIVRTSGELGIQVLSLYAFSTENWQRPQEEVRYLMGLLTEYLISELDELMAEDVKIKAIGDLNALPGRVLKILENAMEKTAYNKGLTLNLALSYGGRDELIRSTRKIALEIKSTNLTCEEINEALIRAYLDTKDQPDPDLIIRTSGEMRLSNFLLFQGAYAELWFTNTLWPDFTKDEYLKALLEYSKRTRRFGKA